MIFDTIYEFYYMLFASETDLSPFWANWPINFWDPSNEVYHIFYPQDYFASVCAIVTIICGIFALFRILGGVLRLFKV